VSRYSQHSSLSHWRSTISGTVACVSCWSTVPSALAQEPVSPSLIAFLSVSTIPPDCLRSNINNERTKRQALTERELQPVLMPHRTPTDAEAWVRFETEYSPPQKSPSPIKRQIETAKYGLDTALFAVDRFIKNVKNQADFSFDQGSLRHTRATPFGESLINPRVKLDLDMWQGSRPYVGVRLIIPFGN
jgi:hypothetical protein